MNRWLLRLGTIWLLAFATLLIAGCTYPTRATGPIDLENVWTGRLSVQVQSSPAQSLSAAFELRGNAHSGRLNLTSPLGTQLAQAEWSPSGVLWRTATEQRQFADLDALSLALTGTALPLPALFDWLQGRPTEAAGWRPDLRDHDQGRISAERELPPPAARLRLVLER